MKRIRQLDGVRGVAILAVFLHHAFNIRLLWIGVDLFFILSGFLITGVLIGLKKHSLGSFWALFYSRRARRILPPYLLALTVASFVIGTTWLHYWYMYILLNNLIMPLSIPRPPAFEPFWSLAMEEQFYLIWPFAVYFLNERNLRKLAILLIVITPLLRGAFLFPTHWFVFALTPFRMDLFAAGALLWLVWQRNRAFVERRGPALGALLAAIGIAGLGLLAWCDISTYDNTRVGNVFIYESTLFVCLGFMMYALSGHGVGWLRAKYLTYIGKISYSMYLVHLGVIVLLQEHFGRITAAALSLAITIAYASASWYLIEGPLLRHGKAETNLRTASS
jgi:peptidoglycan/LPS O-acetylase OafA/YrhL